MHKDRCKPISLLDEIKLSLASAPSGTPEWIKQRLFFWAACLGLLLVLLNVVSSQLDLPQASATSMPYHKAAVTSQPSTTSVTGLRISPDLNPQPLPVGALQASSHSYGPQLFSPFSYSDGGGAPANSGGNGNGNPIASSPSPTPTPGPNDCTYNYQQCSATNNACNSSVTHSVWDGAKGCIPDPRFDVRDKQLQSLQEQLIWYLIGYGLLVVGSIIEFLGKDNTFYALASLKLRKYRKKEEKGWVESHPDSPHPFIDGGRGMMSQMDHIQISEKESQIMAKNHLGSPLRVYPTNRLYIFVCYIGVILFQLIFLILLIILIYVRLDIRLVISAIFIMCSCQIYAARFLLDSKQRLIHCEEGLLLIRNRIFMTQIEVVRWQEITRIGISIFSYTVYQRGKPEVFTISMGYQSYKELIDLIKEKSKKKIT